MNQQINVCQFSVGVVAALVRSNQTICCILINSPRSFSSAKFNLRQKSDDDKSQKSLKQNFKIYAKDRHKT